VGGAVEVARAAWAPASGSCRWALYPRSGTARSARARVWDSARATALASGVGVAVGVGVGSVGEGVGVGLGSVGEGVGVGGPSVGAHVSARDDGVVGSTWATARPPSSSPNAAVAASATRTQARRLTAVAPGRARRHATRSGLDNDGISSVTLLDPIVRWLAGFSRADAGLHTSDADVPVALAPPAYRS
jgi:hypothetical protein